VSGAIISWVDRRYGAYAVFAQRVSSVGDPMWATNGINIDPNQSQYPYLGIACDGDFGAIIVWNDDRAGGGNDDIYAQRIGGDGEAQWAPNGVGVCLDAAVQSVPELIADAEGGVFITWMDDRNDTGIYDVYAQRISGSGEAEWEADGVPVCTAGGDQFSPQVAVGDRGGALFAWEDHRHSPTHPCLYAQFIDNNGEWGHMTPYIHAANDVPGDQGGSVHLSWYAARPDRFGSSGITNYTIWRAIDAGTAGRALECDAEIAADPAVLDEPEIGSLLRTNGSNGDPMFWEMVDEHGAYFQTGYSRAIPTLFDSTSVHDDYHYFQVIAHTDDPLVYYTSLPDSGYSVDNIGPGIPGDIGGKILPPLNTLVVSWTSNRERDLEGYRIYRGLDKDFVPGDENLAMATVDTAVVFSDFDPSEGAYFKVSAHDIHENESGYALLSPEDFTGVGPVDATPMLALRQNAPNPFHSPTTIRFHLPDQRAVRVTVFSADGRHIRTLVQQTMSEGPYEVVWDGTDHRGRPVASGVYLYRLDAGDQSLNKRMMLIR